MSSLPAGFKVQADDVGDTGPSDLAKAVRDDASPGVEQALRQEGFVRGYQRLWLGPDEAEIIVFIYQFSSAAGATADYGRVKPELITQAPTGSNPFSVDGLPADRTTAVAGTSTDGSAAIVLFAKGIFNVQVVSDGPSLAGLRERVSAVARDQYARI